MFDIGFLELVVILVLSLLVLGPERLPKAARTVGYWFGKARRYVEGMKAQVESEFDTAEVKRLLHNQEVQIRELQGKLQSTGEIKTDEYLNQFIDDDDPGNGHQDVKNPDDETEKKPAAPQYEMIEEDDERWDELEDSNPAGKKPENKISDADNLTDTEKSNARNE